MPNQSFVKRTAVASLTVAMLLASAALQAQNGAAVLPPADMQKLLPASLFYDGQIATAQVRNSGGIRFPDGSLVLATLVDTGGYSTSIAAKYQGQLITESPIDVQGKRLPTGVYGIGFVADNKFVVTDVGGHDVLTLNSAINDALKRPRPLEILADPSGSFRLYAGRRYVVLRR